MRLFGSLGAPRLLDRTRSAQPTSVVFAIEDKEDEWWPNRARESAGDLIGRIERLRRSRPREREMNHGGSRSFALRHSR